VLVAAKVATPPVLDGDASDPAWAAAKAITVEITDGKNFAGGKGEDQGHAEGRLQRRHGVLPGPVRRPHRLHPPRPVPEAGRRQLEEAQGPGRQGRRRQRLLRRQVGDDLEHQQLHQANFDNKGCAVFCHLGEGKPYGNKYTKKARSATCGT
jgi:hypothetical protein